MPYKSWEEINPQLKKLRPKISVEQADSIAKTADEIGYEKGGWGIAIEQFKKSHYRKAGKWVKRESKDKQEESMPKTDELPATEAVTESYVPYGIKSFADLRAKREANEVARTLLETVDDLTEMISGIDYNPEVTNKIAAYETLFSEFIGELKMIISDEMTSENPATEMMVEMAESFEQDTITIEEAEAGKPDLLYMDVQIIRPGWGNSRDNNFYSREMLQKHAQAFAGAKMYESEHGDKTTRDWVSTIQEIKGFTDDGAPIAHVAVHDPGFAQRIRNLKAAGLLEKMECSILASGSAKPFELAGRKGRQVESITEVSSVDWVTRAGAGGKALSLAENGGTMPDQENQTVAVAETVVTTQETAPVTEPVVIKETQPQTLTTVEVEEILKSSNLPEHAKEQLTRMTWKTATELHEAIAKEREYIKELSGSGRPFGMAETAAIKVVAFEEVEKRKDAVIEKYSKK